MLLKLPVHHGTSALHFVSKQLKQNIHIYLTEVNCSFRHLLSFRVEFSEQGRIKIFKLAE
jgi:hypothetical protein